MGRLWTGGFNAQDAPHRRKATMERKYQQGREGGGRNERYAGGGERMRGLGGEWYGRDASGQSRHQRSFGDQDREYARGSESWNEDDDNYGTSERQSGFWRDSDNPREQSWAGQGGSERGFGGAQRYRSGGEQASFRAGSRPGDYGDYDELRAGGTRSGAYRDYGSAGGRTGYGDYGDRSGQFGARGEGGLARGYRGDYDSLQRTQPYRYGSDLNRGQGFRGRGPKNYTRSDDRIREDLNEQLMDADDIDASDVSVEVKDGVVTLSGNVEQRWIKHRIEDLAGECSGVKDVRNEIRVQSRGDWPYDKQMASGSLGSTASSQGTSATSSGVSSSSRNQSGSSPH